MDVLTKAYGQLVDLLRAMTPRTRLTAAVLLIVIVASLGYLWRREVVGESTYLLGGQVFSLDEITSMQGALGKAQLNDFAIEGNRIRIPQSKQAAYLAALADANALPQTINDIFSESTEQSSWLKFSSRQQQLEQTKATKRKWLATVIRRMKGVESVEVEFEKEEPRGLKQERIASAVVCVGLHGGLGLDEERAGIFQRVTSAALLIDPKDVTVVDKSTNAIFGGRASSAAAGASGDPYRAAKRQYQTYYEETVRKALAPHVAGVTVSADVELERELRREETRVEFDRGAAGQARPNEAAAAVAGQESGSWPRLSPTDGANQPANLAAVAAEARALLEKVTAVPDPAPSHNRTTTEIAGLTPKRVAISVGVPNSHFENIWRQGSPREPTAAPPVGELARIEAQVIAQIRQCVAGSIADAGSGRGTTTVVTVTPFTTITTPEAPAPTAATEALEWLQTSWGTVAAIIVTLVFLVTLRSMARAATRRAPIQTGRAGTRIDARDEAAAPAPHFKSPATERPSSGRSLQDELSDMVRDDPAAAAKILRSWIGNAH